MRRVIAAIDLGKNVRIAQRREMRIVRDVSVRVDAGGYHPAVPDVAVDVARQVGRRQHDNGAHRGGKEDDYCRRVSRPHPAPHEPSRQRIDRTLRQRHDDKPVDAVLPLRVKPGPGQGEQDAAAAAKTKKSPAHKRGVRRRNSADVCGAG